MSGSDIVIKQESSISSPCGSRQQCVMMGSPCIYFVEFIVRDGNKLVQEFTRKYGFRLIAERSSNLAKQWVVRSGTAVCLVTKLTGIAPTTYNRLDENRLRSDKILLSKDPYLAFNEDCDVSQNSSSQCYDMRCGTEHDEIVDTVCNVALKVKDVGACVRRMEEAGATILKPHTSISDDNGVIEVAMVKSCVGNVIHTLIQCENYSGVFLPHFKAVNSNENLDETYVTHFDHVTFACTVGSSKQVLDWYEKCFGMQRFLMNRDEEEEHGFVIDTADIGLRLKAMEYWHCAEVGLTSPGHHHGVPSLKFVIAEALPGQGPNQVDTFLKEHGGPGIQHIGLHTPDIVKTVSSLQCNGVQFAEPPFTYYTEIGKLKDIQEIGQDVLVLKENGILVDAEADPDVKLDSKSTDAPSTRFLMQKFTKPLFDRNTFFLELIHRAGARGFGSGNIIALWRSVQAYMSAQSDHPNLSKDQSADS